MVRQGRKEAAAARDLLKVDAARMRKAGAAPMRKAAGAPKPKDVAAALRTDVAAPTRNIPVRGTASRSFLDGSCFLSDGSAGDFYSSPGPSSQPWNHQYSDPAVWGTNATPAGGFTNLIQPNMSQNFIFGGEPSQYAPFRPPRSTQDVESSGEEAAFFTPISAKDNNSYVNVESSGEEAPRTEKRIYWSQEEDVRMMSAWLLNSTDSSCGADRKNDQYWTDVEATYNETEIWQK